MIHFVCPPPSAAPPSSTRVSPSAVASASEMSFQSILPPSIQWFLLGPPSFLTQGMTVAFRLASLLCVYPYPSLSHNSAAAWPEIHVKCKSDHARSLLSNVVAPVVQSMKPTLLKPGPQGLPSALGLASPRH